MAKYIEGKTANDVWEQATNMLLLEKESIGGRGGEVYEMMHTFITIENPRQKWIYNRIPVMSIGYALAELMWILNGDDRADVINSWNPMLPSFAGNGEVYYGAYGKRIRSHFGFDQLEKAYNALQNIPESRQVVIQIYDTQKDFPVDNGKARAEDIPCNICSLLKVRNGKLEWSQIMRSNDIFLGMPYNFVQFTSLQEIMAGWLQLDLGTYNHYSDSLHLYKRDCDKINIDNLPEINNSDSLSLPKIESESIIKEIYDRMLKLSKNINSEKELCSLAILDSNYEAYNNIMLIISAYIAHKKRYYDLVKDFIKKCSNNLYVEMWNRWSGKKN